MGSSNRKKRWIIFLLVITAVIAVIYIYLKVDDRSYVKDIKPDDVQL